LISRDSSIQDKREKILNKRNEWTEKPKEQNKVIQQTLNGLLPKEVAINI
jgi:hypothetical protein